MLIPKIWLSPEGDGGGGQELPPVTGGGEPQVPVAAPQPGQETPQVPQTAPAQGAPGPSSVPDVPEEFKEVLTAAGYPATKAGLQLYVHDSEAVRAQILEAKQAQDTRKAEEVAQTAEGQLMNELLSGLASVTDAEFWQNPKKAMAIALGTALKKHTDLMGRAMLSKTDAQIQAAIRNSREQTDKEVAYYMEHPEMIHYAQLNRDLRQTFQIPGSVAAKVIEHVAAHVSGGNQTAQSGQRQQPPVGSFAVPPDLMTVALSRNPSSLGIEMSPSSQGTSAQPDIWDQMAKETEALTAKGKTWDEAEAEVFAKHPEAFNW